ncbi:MAG: gamma-glutamyltransferase family protein [Rhodocyclaceae bacterium]|nr:gamma-glutamyltransferase family protein [Rhodocyclaceae bacterium]
MTQPRQVLACRPGSRARAVVARCARLLYGFIARHARRRCLLPWLPAGTFAPLLAVWLFGASLAAAAASTAEPEPAGPRARSVAVAEGGRQMVVSANAHATRAADAVLQAGGCAIDAAIAAQLVLGLVEPQSSGIGGGGFLLHYAARKQRADAYDGRETAPAAARLDRFLEHGRPLPRRERIASGLSVGVPGLIPMLEMAHRAHGCLPWPRLFEPAIDLAEEGFVVSPRLAQLVAEDPDLRASPSARSYFYDAAGHPVAAGARLVNPALAATLRALAADGAAALMAPDHASGLARAIVAAVRADRRPGDLAAADFIAYRAQRRSALCGNYRDVRVCGMPPPSSGAVTVLQILGMLQRFAPDPAQGERFVHRFAAASRLAFADRDAWLGDPDFQYLPLDRLLAAPYLARRSNTIGDNLEPGPAASGLGRTAMPPGEELPATTHLSIVDARGNAVALTSSIEDAFGSRIMVAGFLLNNQLTDFSTEPLRDGRLAANRVEPGKRPLSSMAPTLLFDRDGRLLAVLGSPGGTRIIGYVAQAVAAVVDGAGPAGSIVSAAHFGNRNGATELEQGAPEELKTALSRRGHRLELGPMTSGLALILRTPQGWSGAADPRREGHAMGR